MNIPSMDLNHCGNLVELYIRFAIWAGKRDEVSAEDIMVRFKVKRSTAFRWKRAWLDANGIHEGQGRVKKSTLMGLPQVSVASTL